MAQRPVQNHFIMKTFSLPQTSSQSPADERGSSSAEQDEDEGSESGRESSQGSKRKRSPVETESDGHSGADTGSKHPFYIIIPCVLCLYIWTFK